VQWELGVKQTAVWPSTLKSTLWRAWYEVALVRRLARTAFSPTPSVDAALVRVTRRPVPLIPIIRHATIGASSPTGSREAALRGS
jgi:23S rRNA (adenine-N6)-dimethyltransferase